MTSFQSVKHYLAILSPCSDRHAACLTAEVETPACRYLRTTGLFLITSMPNAPGAKSCRWPWALPAADGLLHAARHTSSFLF